MVNNIMNNIKNDTINCKIRNIILDKMCLETKFKAFQQTIVNYVMLYKIDKIYNFMWLDFQETFLVETY